MSDGASACQEAYDVVNGARQEMYGSPGECLANIGRVWGTLLGVPDIAPGKVALMMVGLKLVREAYHHKRDNLVDIAGYAETADMAYERR